MRSKTLALILVTTLTASLIGLFLFASEGGFGGQGHGMANETTPRSLWLILTVIPLIIAFSAIGYSLAFPDLNTEKTKKQTTPPTPEKGESTLDAVLRVLNEDEKKVIETLVTQGGTTLQKDIRWKTGYSRVKTHRILSRLAKRGIITAEKHYNTNKITLAKWLTKKQT